MAIRTFRIDPIKALLLFSVALFSFAYGMASRHFQVFPYSLVRDAKQALEALVSVAGGDEEESLYKDKVLVPTVRNHAGIEGNEFILVSGGQNYMKDEYENGCLAWLMDRQGNVRHVWQYDPDTWSDLKKVSTVPGKTELYPIGLHLYEDGGLLVNYQGFDCYPFAIGLARFDRDSNLLWKKELLSHHWFTVADDGRIFVPALHLVETPIPLGETRAQITSDTQSIYSEVILILDPDGNVLDEIPMLDALFDSGWGGLIHTAGMGDATFETDDPTHLNDVRLASAEFAESIPWLNPGDLLVSFRNINAVGILDPQTRRFKWMTSGRTMRQHSPRFYNDGVLIFDNMGGKKEFGGTRLLYVDLDTHTPRQVFPVVADFMPDKFYAQTAGHIDLHRDGERALMALNSQGALWEVHLEEGKVMWEYIHAHPDGNGERQRLLTAKYVYDPTFPLNRAGENP